MDINNPLVSTLILMIASLFACAVLFIAMKSTAVVTRQGYRLGGAVAAFFILFPMTCYIYNNDKPKESQLSPLRVPNGFKEIILRDAKLAMAIPKDYMPEGQTSMQMYGKGGREATIMVASAPNENPSDCNNPANVIDVLQQTAKISPYMPAMRFERDKARLSPINGLNSAEMPGTFTIGTRQQSLIFRIICDDRLDRLVFLSYPESTDTAIMVSTLFIKP